MKSALFYFTFYLNAFTLEKSEVKKSEIFINPDPIEYVLNSVIVKTILNKRTGNVSAVSVDSGQALAKTTSRFDTFIQVIDGNAEIVIEDKSNLMTTGQSIIIPAHTRNEIKARERFKMTSTTIKSGYEDLI